MAGASTCKSTIPDISATSTAYVIGTVSATTSAIDIKTEAATADLKLSVTNQAGGQISTTSANNIVSIFQFKAPYSISEITDVLQNKMAMAIANLLNVGTNNVILKFTSTILRVIQREAVIVSVSLVNFQGSTSALASIITKDNINSAMGREGLASVELVTTSSSESGSSTSQGISQNT